MRPELEIKANTEVDKLYDVDFIETCMYPTWLANIVPVKKKNGRVFFRIRRGGCKGASDDQKIESRVQEMGKKG